ncbi:MAG: helix-turn-helix transcriptional regulator, partial [Clostridia bacterium]|nr:helix-turn-helix transcriptional regulator [Clostridia bacterium]
MNNVKEMLPKNLVKLRSESKMTQSEVAEKLNYTDKSVSKWERGEAIPPIDVLKDLADLYGVSLDYLVGNTENGSYDRRYTSKANNTNKVVIMLLAVSLVWIVATVLYAYGIIFAHSSFWTLFVGAVPLTTVVLIVFNGIWGKRKFTFILISVLIWTLITTIYLVFLTTPSRYNLWAIFIIGIPLQVA